MIFNDIWQIIPLLLIISVLVIGIKTIHQTKIKKIFSQRNVSYGLYSAHRFVWIDATAQTIIFLMFDWHISALLWIATIPLNLWLFKFMYKKETSVKKYTELMQKFQVNLRNNAKTRTHTEILLHRHFQEKECKYRAILFNTAVTNPKSHISWLYIHLSAPALIWITIFLEKTSLLPALNFSSKLEQILYDLLCSYGTCAIIYWIGYIIESSYFRYGNWRRWYHIIYFVFLIIWWMLFLLIELHMFS